MRKFPSTKKPQSLDGRASQVASGRRTVPSGPRPAPSRDGRASGSSSSLPSSLILEEKVLENFLRKRGTCELWCLRLFPRLHTDCLSGLETIFLQKRAGACNSASHLREVERRARMLAEKQESVVVIPEGTWAEGGPRDFPRKAGATQYLISTPLS